MAGQIVSVENARHYVWGDRNDGWHLLANADLSVIQERVLAGGSEAAHQHHKAQQFFYILRGAAVIDLQGERHHLMAGQGLAVLPGQTHCFRNESSQPVEFLVISSPPSHGDRLSADAGIEVDRQQNHRQDPPIQIGRLTPDNAAEYRLLMLAAYRDHPQAFTSSVAEREALPIAWWAQRLQPGGATTVFGAWLAGELQGVVGLNVETGARTRHKATLFGMYLKPPSRGFGAARALVEAVKAAAIERGGIRNLKLTVSADNQVAHALYRSCGFTEFGREANAVALGDGFITKIHMWWDPDTGGQAEPVNAPA